MNKFLKIAGPVLTGAGLIIQVAKGIVESKVMEAEIKKAAEEAVANVLKNK